MAESQDTSSDAKILQRVIECLRRGPVGSPSDGVLLPHCEASERALRQERRQTQPPVEGEIYFMYLNEFDAIKIGYSNSPTKRLKTMQTGLPCDLQIFATMPGTRQMETTLHKKFWASGLRGEWFNADEDVLEYIRENATLYDDAAIKLMEKLWAEAEQDLR